MFDFDIQNIISIQPKKRGKTNIFNNVDGYVAKSTIVNNNTSVVKNESLARPQRSKRIAQGTLLHDALEANAVEHGRELDAVGVNILKPELICAMKFLPTSNKDIRNFINYSYKFREYKQEQVRNMLSIIDNADTPDSTELKLLQDKFKTDLDDIIYGLSSFFTALSTSLTSLNLARRDLIRFTNINTLTEGSLHQRIASKIIGNNNNRVEFQDQSPSEVLNYLIAAVARHMFSTSLNWDSNIFVNTVKHSQNGFQQCGRVQNQFSFRNNLRQNSINPSPFHFQDLWGSVRASTTDMLINDLSTNKTRMLMTLLASEFGISKAAAKLAHELNNGAAALEPDIINNLLTDIRSFNEPVIINNSLMVSNININDQTNNIIPLEFIDKNLPIEGDKLTQEELINKFGKSGFDDSFITGMQQHGENIRSYINKFFPQNPDVGANFIVRANNETIRQFNLIEQKIVNIFNGSLGQPGTPAAPPNPAVADLMQEARDNPTINPYGDRRGDIEKFALQLVPRNTAMFVGDMMSVSTMTFYSLFSSLASDNSDTSRRIAQHLMMLAYTETSYGWRRAQHFWDDDNGDQNFKRISKYWPKDQENIRLSVAGRDVWRRRNRRIAIKGILFRISIQLGLNLSQDTLTRLSEGYASSNGRVIRTEQTDNITVRYRLQGQEIFDISLSAMLGDFCAQLLVAEDSFIKQIVRQFSSLEEDQEAISVYYDTFTRNDSKEQLSWYSQIETSTLFQTFFELVRRIANTINPYSIRSVNNEIQIYLPNSFEDADANMRYGRLVMSNDITENGTYALIMRAVKKQYSENAYNEFKQLIHRIAQTVLPGYQLNQEFPLFRQYELDAFNNVLKKFEEDNIQTDFDRDGVNLIDQIQPIISNVYRSSILNQNNILNIEDHITSVEKNLVVDTLTSEDGSLVIQEEFDRRRGDPFRRFDIGSQASKLLVIGIPTGFKNEINKLFYDQEGIDIDSLNDDLSFSKVIVEVYAQNVSLEPQYFLLKRAKFDLDYFISVNDTGIQNNSNITTIDQLKIFDFNKFSTVGQVMESNDPNNNRRNQQEDAQVDRAEYTRRRNEAISYMFKKYIQIMYGINFSEGQFFMNRDMLEKDPAGSDDSEFIKKFETIINNLVNEKLKIKTLNQQALTKNIESLISHTGRTSILRTYSNDLVESTQRRAIDKTLTNEQRELKFELEDMALNLATAYRFSESISGGRGFFERLVAPKLFEKILIIDIPVAFSDINDYYIKIRMDNSEE